MIARGGAALGLTENEDVGPIEIVDSDVMGKTKAGGQSADRLEDAERRAMRGAVDQFFDALSSEPDGEELVYGRDEVAEALEYDAVETALVSTDLPIDEARTIHRRTEDAGGECVIVPTDFEKGERFADAFGGVAAFLRFPVE